MPERRAERRCPTGPRCRPAWGGHHGCSEARHEDAMEETDGGKVEVESYGH
jgi:hypothetical protein